MISEEYVENYAERQTPAGETPLAGVYAAMRNRQAIWHGLLVSGAFGNGAGGAVAGATANIWSILCVNDKHIVIGEIGYTGKQVKNTRVIPRQRVTSVKIRPGLITHIIKIRLSDGSRLKFIVGRWTLGHKMHPQRYAQIAQYLQS